MMDIFIREAASAILFNFRRPYCTDVQHIRLLILHGPVIITQCNNNYLCVVKWVVTIFFISAF